MIKQWIAALREMRAFARDCPDLGALALSSVLGTLGAGLLAPIIPLWLESRGFDPERIGLVFSLGSLLPLALQPALGALSDHFDRRRFVICLSMITSLLVPVLALAPTPMFLAAALATKLLLERSGAPVTAALIGDRAPAAKRATFFGILSSVSNFVFVASLVCSSAAVALLRVHGVFFLAGACFLLSSLALFRLPAPPRVKKEPSAPQRSHLQIAALGVLSPFREAARDRDVLALLGYTFCFTFALDLFPIYLPLFATELGAPPASVGPICAASWLVYAIVLPAGGRLSDRFARRKGLILGGLAGMAIFTAILGLSGLAPRSLALPFMVFAWVAMAIPDGLFRPSADALSIDLAPPEERGRFLGALGASCTLANVIAPLVYGVVAKRRSLSEAFLLSAFSLVCALLFVTRIEERAKAPLSAEAS